jgi:peptide/nickel transport system substrate-binding protein
MEKKNIAITVLLIALIASGIGNIILAFMINPNEPSSREGAYIRSTSSGPHTLEIVDAWDSASNDVLEQCVETLFFYDLTNVSLPMINLLAESYYWVNETVLQIKLREGVTFQDGTDFNAAAAKWNLDRLNYLINATGDNHDTVAQTKSLWSFPDGVTPIMKSVAAVGDYNITITLNDPYAPFLATLSYINSGMISPTFHADDAESFIPLSGDIVGTGPYMFDSFTPDVEVRLSRFDNYWGAQLYGHGAYFPLVIFAIYDDANTAHQAFLSGSIDANAMASDQNIETYRTRDDIYVQDFTLDTGKPSLVYQYMGVNNHKYNATWRKVFAFAVNYSYVIDELRLGNAFRSYTAISPGFGAAYNASVPLDPRAVPDQGNVTVARETLQSMGYGTGLDVNNDAAWISQANSAPFATVRYTYNLGNTFREDLFVAVTSWLKLVGCATEDDGVQWDQFLDYLYDVGGGTPDQGFDHLELYAIGWAPDYLSPYNMLDPLFNPVSGSNSAQVDDPTLNTMMAAALTETNPVDRDNTYKDIQSYMATQGFNHIPLYHSKVIGLMRGDIYGVQTNAMGALRIYPIYRSSYRV